MDKRAEGTQYVSVEGGLSRVVDTDLPDIQRGLSYWISTKEQVLTAYPHWVLKHCAHILAPHLALHFGALLRSGVFPAVLKQSYIVPIHKSGDKANVMNYRPISIQPAIAKVFESVVLDFLYFRLSRCMVMEQHGFMRGTLDCDESSSIPGSRHTSALVSGHQVDCVYLDYAKSI
ncbi:uncharacterized protein LOC124363652 [Homalodisca vitripennis]|uniref:uncharacterized protein LOC124363652 n=1 Tax=Homalodisca vitripennis TaxID=197043 RepID=UPI001EEAA080|nr:uncharacterized protein LOC124363652 [Homalodisca vitripennis]